MDITNKSRIRWACRRGMRAVSYTHLDVYKRQVISISLNNG
ncbi:hypothetical protein [Erwinia amylovora]